MQSLGMKVSGTKTKHFPRKMNGQAKTGEAESLGNLLYMDVLTITARKDKHDSVEYVLPNSVNTAS